MCDTIDVNMALLYTFKSIMMLHLLSDEEIIIVNDVTYNTSVLIRDFQ